MNTEIYNIMKKYEKDRNYKANLKSLLDIIQYEIGVDNVECKKIDYYADSLVDENTLNYSTFQLRPEPANPLAKVSVWNCSTVQPDDLKSFT